MTELAEKTNSTNISTNTNAPARPGANPSDSTMARAQGQAQSAVKGMAEQQHTAVTAEKLGAKTLASESPDQAPKWQDKTSQSAGEQVGKAGQSMQSAGVTTGQKGPSEVAGHGVDTAPQSADMKAKLQAALDKSAGNGQNAPTEGSKCAAAQQQAAAAPPAAPAAAQSMNK